MKLEYAYNVPQIKSRKKNAIKDVIQLFLNLANVLKTDTYHVNKLNYA